MGFHIWDEERTREKTIKRNIIFIYFLFPFSLKYEFQNYLDMNYSIIRNILYSNICRRHNFLYNEFSYLGSRENKRENNKKKYYFHLFLFPFSLQSQFQNYLDMNFSIMKNILYSNHCRRHYFLYSKFQTSLRTHPYSGRSANSYSREK
jgi:hypothetical protein